MKILAVDVGNTSVYAAVIAQGRIGRRARFSSKAAAKAGLASLASLAKREKVDSVVVGSVVPRLGKTLVSGLRKKGLRAQLIGRDLQVPVPNRYKNPRQVGADRLLNAAAAWEEHEHRCIVVDFGTAITFDVVSAKGEYLGGVIAPGIEITLEALFERTALLPRIRLEAPKSVVGRDTVEAIRSGCTYGLGGLCDRIVDEIGKGPGPRPIVVFTGGYAPFMARYCRRVDQIDPDLTLKGIYLTACSQS